jgi:hypothetical protein
MLSVVMLNVSFYTVFMQNVVMLSVIMLNVEAPWPCLALQLCLELLLVKIQNLNCKFGLKMAFLC